MLKTIKQFLRAWESGVAGGASAAAPAMAAKTHRPFGATEAAFLRRVVRKGSVNPAGSSAGPRFEDLPHAQNPGVRVVAAFASEDEAVAAVAEARAVVAAFGSSHVTAQHRAVCVHIGNYLLVCGSAYAVLDSCATCMRSKWFLASSTHSTWALHINAQHIGAAPSL